MSVQLGTLVLDSPLILAPMAGVSDLPFRRACRSEGAGLVFTEMISARGLSLGAPNSRRLLASDGSDRPLAAQIFGSDPAVMAEAARICQEEGADLVDINMGCPVPKVVRKGAGAALLKDTLQAVRVMDAVRRVLAVPLTIKIRSGWTVDRPVALEMGRLAQECGVDAITLHARARSEGYSCPARWPLIAQLRESTSLPVIGNGDVGSVADVLAMRRETGCHGVMIGRAARGNPWIFSQGRTALQGHPAPPPPDPAEIWRVLSAHMAGIDSHYAPHKALHLTKAHLLRYVKGIPGSAAFREAAARATDLDSLRSATHGFLMAREWTVPAPRATAASPIIP
jgi:nifR3 family TIM-barrel protein